MLREIGIIFVFAGVIGVLFKLLRQPLIPAYVLAGALIGPLFLNMVSYPDVISELSEIAVVVMLFVIGIEMDLSRLKKLGLVSMLGGAIQVGVTFAMGFLLSRMLGLNNVAAIYLGFATSFSSTMLVVKILGEKYDMDTLYGRISIGILVMQDILAIFALSILTTLNNFSPNLLLSTFTMAAGLILIIVFIGGKFIFPRVFDYVARDREILFIISMAILFLAAFYAEQQKLSLGIGSFLAGLAIARLSYKYEIIGDLKALKSFFTILFFASLGLQLAPPTMFAAGEESCLRIGTFFAAISGSLTFIVAFFVLAVIVKPLLSMVIVAMFGYERSSSFNAGLSLGQLSEFSLVLISQGIAYKHLEPALLPPIIIITVLSLTVSSYSLKYSLSIYRMLNGKLKWLDKIAISKQTQFDLGPEPANDFEIVLIGRDKLGSIVEKALRKRAAKYVVVDSNPDVISSMRSKGVPCIFGDIINHEVLGQLDFAKIKTVFSTIPDNRDNELMIRYIKKANPNVSFVAITEHRDRAAELYALGADFVLVTYLLAGEQLLMNKGERGANLDSLLGDSRDVREMGKEHCKNLYGDFFESPSMKAACQTSEQ